MRSILIVAISGMLAVPSIATQQPDPCLERAVLVSVIDAHRRPLPNLSPTDFRAQVQGHPVVINAIRSGPAQRRAALLLDVSGSMSGSPNDRKWRIATAAVRAIVAAVPEQWPIAFITAGEQVEVQANFTGPRADLAKVLASYAADAKVAKGRTALVDGIWTALKLLEPRELGDTIFVVTDGGDNKSKISFEKMQKALVASRVKFIVILVTNNAPRTEEERVGPVPAFADLALQTGGWNIWVDDSVIEDQKRATAIARTIEVLARDPGMILELHLPEAIRDWHSWRLELIDEQGHKRKQFIVNYPLKLGPCH